LQHSDKGLLSNILGASSDSGMTPTAPRAHVQVGFGSGFKCNSAIWKALRPVRDVHPAWAHQANGGRRDPDFLVNSPDGDDEN